jgi:hypothetical protein
MMDYLDSVRKRFRYYKTLGDKALDRTPEDRLNWQSNFDTNSMATLVKHISGNMRSRWTDFLTTDGEKQWRQRDNEFDDQPLNRQQVLELWEDGWKVFLSALDQLQPDDFYKVITIRGEEHTVLDAVNRQLAHYPYHIGQMVFLAKMLTMDSWESLSIPKKSPFL